MLLELGGEAHHRLQHHVHLGLRVQILQTRSRCYSNLLSVRQLRYALGDRPRPFPTETECEGCVPIRVHRFLRCGRPPDAGLRHLPVQRVLWVAHDHAVGARRAEFAAATLQVDQPLGADDCDHQRAPQACLGARALHGLHVLPPFAARAAADLHIGVIDTEVGRPLVLEGDFSSNCSLCDFTVFLKGQRHLLRVGQVGL
mmetsp:Transcript_63873/g.161908  ORF Transcript_63873/g.161908 Transcript_63873/m.161908 type:complete len:200 (-) Transcript_63873:150-749(-)